MKKIPAITPEGAGRWMVRPFGNLAPDREALLTSSEREAEWTATRLALKLALRAHAFEGALLTLCSELEHAEDGLVVPVDLALKLRRLRQTIHAEVEADMARWEASL